jgi:hypothetical protein
MKIIDNFLSNEDFNILEKEISGSYFPWFYSDFKTSIEVSKKYDFQFTHFFIRDNNIVSPHFEIIKPLINKLQSKKIIRVKANLTTRTSEIIKYDLHTDYDYDCNIAIFYVNTNDGYTFFDTGKTVNSVENRVLLFNNSLKHSGTSCTKYKKRIVININYI